jgi:signal peptidase I
MLVGFTVRVFRVRSTSMAPTLLPGELVLAVRGLGHPARGDLVALRGPTRWRLKRVVGLPGDALALRETRLHRNQRLVSEPHAHYLRGGQADLPAVVVRGGELVVLGDNRDHSVDSRQLGPFPVTAARFRLAARLWPPARAGWLR